MLVTHLTDIQVSMRCENDIFCFHWNWAGQCSTSIYISSTYNYTIPQCIPPWNTSVSGCFVCRRTRGKIRNSTGITSGIVPKGWGKRCVSNAPGIKSIGWKLVEIWPNLWKHPFQRLHHISASSGPFPLILDALETHFKVLFFDLLTSRPHVVIQIPHVLLTRRPPAPCPISFSTCTP